MNNILPLKDYSAIHANSPDEAVKRGETWVHHTSFDNYVNVRRHNSLKNWWMGILYRSRSPFERWAMIFWENFLGIQSSKLVYAVRSFRHYDIIRTYALGDYREMLCEIILMQTAMYHVKKTKPRNISISESLSELLLRQYIAGPDYLQFTSREKIKKLKKLLNEWNLLSDTVQSKSKKRSENTFFDYNNFIHHPEVREFITELNVFMGKLIDYTNAGQYIAKKIFIWRYNRVFNGNEMNTIIIPASESFYQGKYNLYKLISGVCSHSEISQKTPVEFIIDLIADYSDQHIISTIESDNYPFYEWLRMWLIPLGQEIADIPDDFEWRDYFPSPIQQKWLSNNMLARKEEIETNILQGLERVKLYM